MKRILILFFILGFISQNCYSQNCDLSTDCGDIIADWGLANNVVFVCEGEPFEVQVNPSTSANIDSIVWIWDDGQITTTSSTANQTHVYAITDSVACLIPTQEVFSITMEVYRYCADGTSCHSQTAPVAVRFKPRAFINVPSEVCKEVDVDFINASCNGEVFQWEFGDGNSSSEENPTHQYLNTGTYTVTLTVTNECGPDVTTQQVTVVEPAKAKALVIDSGLDTTVTPIIVCLGNPPILLNGDSLSVNESFYEWNSLIGQEANWILPMGVNDPTPNIPDPYLSFSDTGLFEIILEVDNLCNQPDFDTLYFQVLSGTSLNPLAEPDGCISVDYTPSNFNDAATYTINNDVINNSDFPITLGPDIYIVEGVLMNECGNQVTLDTFEIFAQEDVTINSADTTLCVSSDSLMIFYTPTGGTWMGEHLIFYGDSVFFDPVEVGEFEIFYKKGVDDCEDIDTIIITVEGINVMVNDVEVCSTSAPFQMVSTPSGGTYSSTDCPTCINGNEFIVSELVANGLTSAEVNYIVASSSGCEGNNTFTISIENPIADFIVDSIFCFGDPVSVDISNTNGNLQWMIDGQNVGSPPFSNLSTGNHTIKLTASAGNCEVMMTDEIYITSPPMNVSFSAVPLEGCADLEVTLLNETGAFDNPTFEWYLDGELFSTAIQPGTITLGQGLNDTTYTISLSAGNSCDGQIFSETITVFPRPVPQFGPMQNSYCSGDTVTFSNVSFGGPMTSWLWDYGNGMTSTDSIPLQIIYFTDTIPTTYTISLTATNDCGTETFAYDLIINPTDVSAFFNIDPIQGCVGVPVCLTNLSTLGATVLWDFGDGNTSTQFDICHTYQQAGNYTITLKAFGCGFDSIQFDVVIHPTPNAAFSNNTITCPGDTLVFTNTSTLADSYLWDFGDGTTSTLNNPTHVFATAGNFLVKLYATSVEGCVDSTEANVAVLIPPTANFTIPTNTICEQENITFTNTTSPTPLSCFWDFGDGNFSNVCSPTHNYLLEGSYLVTLISTNNDGCRDTTQEVINVLPLPVPAFDFSQNDDCSPSIIAFINESNIAQSYLWEFGDGNTSTETTPEHTYLAGGNYMVTLTATNGICSESITKQVSVIQTPNTQIILPLGSAGCAAYDASFTANPINSVGTNYNYKWDFGDGEFSFDANPIHTFSTPGIYEVMLIVDEDGSCPDTAMTSIEVFEPIEATTATIDNLCFGDAMGNIDLTISNGTPNYQFLWSNGLTTEDNPNLPAGTYSVTITDDNQCIWSEAIEILQPAAPLSINILEENIVSCYGGSDGGLSIEGNGGTMNYDYLWDTGSTSTSIENVPAGNYNITITDANDCILEEILTVNQNDSISYDALISNISCFGFDDGQINLENFSGGVAPYFVMVPQLDSLEGTGFNDLMSDDYVIEISDALGCTQLLNTTIFEPPMIWIELEEDSVEINLGEQIPILSNYNVANPSFVWTPDRWLSCYDCDEPMARPFDDITFEVLMTDENGCEAKDTIFIAVEDERRIAIPNIFTPNNDGENDFFKLLGDNPAVETILSFQIFDRYGGILYEKLNFELNDPAIGWDGKFGGIDVQVGNYVYLAKVRYIDGEVIDWKGGVMLIR